MQGYVEPACMFLLLHLVWSEEKVRINVSVHLLLQYKAQLF